MSNDLQTTVQGAVRSSDLLCVRLRHLDLFSGIGGFALAAQRAGWNTIGFSEIEPYACKILKRHWPDVPNYGDIRNVRGVSADLITGGFPCQPYSLAGKRGGVSDDRALWPEMHRVIAETRPAWVLGENVPGIINLELDRVLSDMETIGYTAGALSIPACAVDARHRRERIWIVAHAERDGLSGRAERRGVAASMGKESSRTDNSLNAQGASGVSSAMENVADALGSRLEERQEQPARKESFPDTRHNGQRLGERIQWDEAERCEGGFDAANGLRWPPEPELGRVAHGIPNRAHRLRGLGNAIVPQVAEPILRWMLQITQGEDT